MSITSGGNSFWIRALQDVGEKIKTGFHVLIDPDAVPRAIDFVLIGENLESWRGQAGSRGVVILAGEEI